MIRALCYAIGVAEARRSVSIGCLSNEQIDKMEV